MILDYQIRDAKKSIKEELRNLLKNCENISADSRAEYVRSMPSGSLVVPDAYLYTEGAKADIEKATTKARENIKATLDGLYSKISDEVTAPPTQDAVNTIQLLKMRNNISADEFILYANKYGNNALVNSMLSEIAKDKELNVQISKPKELALAEGITSFSGQIDKYINNYDATQGKIDNICIIAL